TLLRGQLKSSARPLGAAIGSPLVSTRAATGSAEAAGRFVPAPISSFEPPVETVSGTTGPISGRWVDPGRPPRAAPGPGVGSGAVGNATGSARLAMVRWISRST